MVTYHPDEDVTERITVMSAECDHIVVVDNGSAEEIGQSIARLSFVTYLPLTENAGIAAALNRGAAWARERGYEWMITFDQDSLPQAGMVSALLATAG
ncbi:MAG TPA: glycosyltransferase, partial [Opitutaceae bacterium]|nr:glycosyltransferase [Opitutaceae bacterium]